MRTNPPRGDQVGTAGSAAQFAVVEPGAEPHVGRQLAAVQENAFSRPDAPEDVQGRRPTVRTVLADRAAAALEVDAQVALGVGFVADEPGHVVEGFGVCDARG